MALAAKDNAIVTLLVASLVLNWIVVAGLALVVLALARQVGVLHERIAPVGALSMSSGPKVGEPAPRLEATTLAGRQITLGLRSLRGRACLLLFVSADCPICKVVIPVAKALAGTERIDLVLIGDGAERDLHGLISRFGLGDFHFINGPEIGLAYEVGKLPYAVLLDEHAVIAAKGLVNSREHLESLLVAHEHRRTSTPAEPAPASAPAELTAVN